LWAAYGSQAIRLITVAVEAQVYSHHIVKLFPNKKVFDNLELEARVERFTEKKWNTHVFTCIL